MQKGSGIRKIALVGTYLPRQCGIATFTVDLCSATASEFPESRCFVVPVNDLDGHYKYPKEVRFEIEEQNAFSYQQAADFLNISNVDVVSLQHEFGIFGGPLGSHVLALLRDLKMPVVTTLHTILRDPAAECRRVVQELIGLSTRLVTMTQRGSELMQSIYQAPAAKIDSIPHGIPDMPFVDPNFYKDKFGVEGQIVLLTFGLLSPNKGIEHVLNALPDVLAEFPNLVYIVLGATHPNRLREEGEAYRFSLERLAKRNRLQRNVIFYNRFVDLPELQEFIGAADLYVTPYLNETQITSGTLAYAFGAGKAVISTPYWHATELLNGERGVLVPFADPKSLAKAIIELLRDDTRRHAMRKNAYRLSREMVWSNVAKLYMRSFVQARLERANLSRKIFAFKTLDQQPGPLPDFKFDHLSRMTDSTGIFQHATLTVPNFAEGYSMDDNARALIFTVLLEELGEDCPAVRSLATIYAAFLNYAYNPENHRFRNFLSFDRQWLEEQGSEDSQGRALWALGTCVSRSRRRSFQLLTGQLFNRTLLIAEEFTAPRAWAFTLLGIHEYLRRLSGDRLANQLRDTLTTRLMERFAHAVEDWFWCEDQLTYDNAKLPHALLLSGSSTNQPDVVDIGLQALRWLIRIETSSQGYFYPIGCNGFYTRGGTRANFDQQPLEAYSTVSACLEAYRLTSDAFWYDQARRAFDWFLGWNDLGLELYSSNTGGCYDALHVDRLNQNQGAESTLAFLLSLAEMKLMQTAVATFPNQAAA